jgi:integrase
MPKETRGRKVSPARIKYVPSRDHWRIIDGTTQVVVARGKASRAEAERRLADYLTGKHRPVDSTDADKVPLATVLIDYAETAKTPTAQARLGGQVETLLNFFDDQTCAFVTAVKCREYAKWRMAQPHPCYKDAAAAPRISSSTARRELVTLAAALNLAYRENRLNRPIVVTLPEGKPPRERHLSQPEIVRLLWAALGFWKDQHGMWQRERGVPLWAKGGKITYEGPPRHLYRFILIALMTGTRFDAITRLRWDKTDEDGWFDLDNGIIYRRGDGEAITNKRRNPAPIPPRLMRHLRRWKAMGSKSGYVIEYRGQPVHKIRSSWKAARKRAGLGPEVTPHILKHTCITWLLHKGHSTARVAAFTSTSEDIIQRVYGHHTPGLLRDVADSF